MNLCKILGGILMLFAFAFPINVQADNYKIDEAHSYVVFRIVHLEVGYNWGRFNKISGSMFFKADAPSGNSIKIEIDVNSVDTGIKKRDDHLKSPDFFNVKQYPKATFKSTKWESGDKEGFYKVTGDMTIHGKTKEITIEVQMLGGKQDPWGKYRAGFDTNFIIKRTDFGMDGSLDALSDEVNLIISLETTKG